MKINWRDNDREMVDLINTKMVDIGHAMGAKEVNPFPGYANYDVTRYQSTRVQGGTMMAASPATASSTCTSSTGTFPTCS